MQMHSGMIMITNNSDTSSVQPALLRYLGSTERLFILSPFQLQQSTQVEPRAWLIQFWFW